MKGPRCCAEIGTVNAWHICDRLATVVSERRIGQSVYFLHYCDIHAHKARMSHSPAVVIVSITKVEAA